MKIEKQCKTLDLLEKKAKAKLNHSMSRWLIGASEFGFTEKKNREIFRKVSIVPRVLKGNSNIDLNTNFFNNKINFPLIVSPMGGLTQFDKKAELKIAINCSFNKIPYFHSNYSRYSMQEILKKNKDPSCINSSLYLDDDLNFIKKKLHEADFLNINSISITVDSPIRSISYDKMNYAYDARKKMRKITKELRSELLKKKLKPLNWKSIEKIRKLTKKPLILKGILSYKDAVIAESSGVDAIWISNHGGRSSETDLTALEVLSEIRSKLKKRKTKIICDGGVRTGSDFLKIMCLGADFVGVGRPIVYALIADKQAGLQNYFNLIQNEIKTSFVLGGINKIHQIKKLDLKTRF